MSWIIYEGDDMGNIIKQVKGCVLAEYTPVSEWNEVGYVTCLVRNGDRFEWRDVSDCLPADSDKEYQDAPRPVVNLRAK